jgi:hypothetical protein
MQSIRIRRGRGVWRAIVFFTLFVPPTFAMASITASQVLVVHNSASSEGVALKNSYLLSGCASGYPGRQCS